MGAILVGPGGICGVGGRLPVRPAANDATGDPSPQPCFTVAPVLDLSAQVRHFWHVSVDLPRPRVKSADYKVCLTRSAGVGVGNCRAANSDFCAGVSP